MKRLASKVSALMFAAASLILDTNTAFSKCADSDWIKWKWLINYSGTIGEKSPIQMTLVLSGDNGESVEGVYFYQSQMRDIKLRGVLSAGTDLVLEELDDTGRVSATFNTKFEDSDPKGRFNGSLKCEVITGTWTDGKRELPIYLAVESANGGELHHRYAVAGAEDDEIVDTNALHFWMAIKEGNKSAAAEQISYPIKTKVNGQVTTIKNPNDLIANYDGIFTANFKAAILKSIPKNMFARDQGIMLGDGEVWFGADGKVITLNN